LEQRRKHRYDQLRASIPENDYDLDHFNPDDTETGLSANDLSRFTSEEDLTLKNVDPEPIDDLQVE
jgi:hypothetical protein